MKLCCKGLALHQTTVKMLVNARVGEVGISTIMRKIQNWHLKQKV
jgi:hypothetical protein